MYVGTQQWTVASLATGAAALVTLLLAVATAHWLYMREKCSKTITEHIEGFNYTFVVNFTLISNAGIWQLCTQNDAKTVSCTDSRITTGLDKNDEKDDEQWRTGTVMEATRIQFPVTCLAVLLTLSGFVCSIVGNFRQDKKTIIAAVMYIASGLCLSVGVILYISRINDELSLQESKMCVEFEYQYGWSFYLIGLSFVMEETSAVISIKLYLLRSSNKLSSMVRIIPGLEDKVYVSLEKRKLSDVETNNQTLIW
ncbi:CCG7-like protein [Mya arenaria]|uniref:CCG7-like protein n=1 Tax=Mya arenaria TaxID=6604 RepID=A0ABY7DIA1_MYAAR|nr:voltage-dependent calcium channel gamma-7 subunit-like [Mya arenaria]XP_052785189.1 voltage-dependent calcium channel gamma-7 subunit-like [Mya arenaria]XP_052785197.1 voltage-dependent calcium channel gamma-7 subunit-like [Mya arenaria]WAQ96437.1 CCG7-like protein [Mya arenaria]